MSSLRLVTAVLLVALAAPACSGDGRDDDAFVLQLDGRAEVVRDDEPRRLTSGDHRLSTGDTVRMLDGDAVLELPGDRSVLLRSARGDRDSTVLEVAAVPHIVNGDAVVVAGDEVRFRAGDVDVELASGAARVQRGLGVTVALYAGGAVVRSAGRELPGGLAALRQVSVPATGLLPRRPAPLRYDDVEPDPWDRRFLGDAIDLGSELDRRARGFTGQLGARVAVDAPLLRRVLPRLAGESDFGDGLLGGADRTAGEALVGAAIVVEGGDASFRQRWDDVFAFRDDGARWGLVALDQQVQRDALLATIVDAYSRSPVLFAAPSGSGGEITLGPPTTSPGGGGATTTTTTAPTDEGGGGEPDPTVPPPTAPPPTLPPITVPPVPDDEEPDEPDSDPEEEEPEVVDLLQEVVEDLLGDDGVIRP